MTDNGPEIIRLRWRVAALDAYNIRLCGEVSALRGCFSSILHDIEVGAFDYVVRTGREVPASVAQAIKEMNAVLATGAGEPWAAVVEAAVKETAAEDALAITEDAGTEFEGEVQSPEGRRICNANYEAETAVDTAKRNRRKAVKAMKKGGK